MRGNNRQPSAMGELMSTLVVFVDAWYEMAREWAPHRYQPSDRFEVLGALVRLLAARFQGFRVAPGADAIMPNISRDSVELRIRPRGGAPLGIEKIENDLSIYGFRIEMPAGVGTREIVIKCKNLAGATVLPFPAQRTQQSGKARSKR